MDLPSPHSRRRCAIRPVALVLLIAVASIPGTAPAATLSPALQRQLATLAGNDPVPVILTLRDRVDPGAYRQGRAGAPELVRALRDRAARTQGRLVALLHSRPEVSEIRPFWITNCVAARVPAGMLTELAGLDDLETIDVDEPVRFDEGEPAGGGGVTDWHLSTIHAEQVWTNYHLDGTGIVVGSMDTGFDPNHPALLGKWRGGTNSWTDIINGQPTPYDDHGHGTHTIGTMVGGDGPGPAVDDIGVAYNARFISAKVLDSNNSFSTGSIVIAGAQWMLDPDGNPATNDFPDVINNSWYFSNQAYAGFSSTVDAWRAAGIIPVFCIANFGPGSATTRPPGNYANTIGVGATTNADVVASFSSRGPSPTGAVFPADTRKPDLSAPGQSVRSSVPGGTYAYWNGTSMATPQVAGTVALMLQGNPGLDYATIRSQLIASAVDLAPAGYDFDCGYGRLDAFAATTRAVTGVGETPTTPKTRLRLAPNPFHDRVNLAFEAPAGEAVSVSVFDLAGRCVWSVAGRGPSATWAWDGRDRDGAALRAGVYLVRATSTSGVATRRLVHLR